MKKDASTQLFWEVSGECKLAMLAVKVFRNEYSIRRLA
ncbi:hypothetical protein B279_02825 [Streptococcus equinus ATCC 33317]|nr:hypothetical protein B279_02825 [Streptococcus equinus ATCC 33317]